MVTQFPSKAPKRKQADAVPRKSVGVFSHEKFGVEFSGNEMKLSISTEMMQDMQNSLLPPPGSEHEREFLVAYLGLPPEVTFAIQNIAKVNEITFGEALNFHLIMTLTE